MEKYTEWERKRERKSEREQGMELRRERYIFHESKREAWEGEGGSER